jgi:diguanylate cyclase (GGDEF)-like protein
MVTLLVGGVLWAASDLYQSGQLRSIFHENLEARFKAEAKEHRIRFYRYINSYDPAVRTYANDISAGRYLKSDQWKKNSTGSLVLHEEVPPWLPKISIMRSYIWPRYALLLDKNGKLRELYHYKNPMPPDGLLNISRHKVELSRGQSYVTTFNGHPYVLSSSYINNDTKGPILLIASPIDGELLKKSLGGDADKSVVALLKDGETKILVSSNNKLIPKNATLHDMQSRYYLTGADHFDTGTSDLLLQFVSFISTDEVNNQTEAIISADRRVTAMSAFVFIAAFALVIFRITFRIQKLTNRVVKFSEDMEIVQPRLKKADQIDELESRFELFAFAIRKETEALEHQALHDPLTDLPNRKMFNDQLQGLLLNNTDVNHRFIILLIDLDKFKEINDTLGHHIGDVVLQIAAGRLQNVHRNHDLVARLGGDEFGILLPDTSLVRAKLIVDKILDIFNKPLVVEGHNLEIGLSIGIVEFPTHGYDANILLQRADVAMYAAKHNRTGYSIYESSEDRHTVGRLALSAKDRSKQRKNMRCRSTVEVGAQ